MSLYNKLFGMNEDTPILLGMIGVNREYFERFRDVELINNATIIRVFTRLGGANRKEYQDTWDKIHIHELYSADYDDGFDETYAYIEFKIPEKYKETAKKMSKGEPISFKEKFEKELKEMDTPGSEAFKKAEKIAEEIIKNIEGGNHIINL